jgi:hypothetical protein
VQGKIKPCLRTLGALGGRFEATERYIFAEISRLAIYHTVLDIAMGMRLAEKAQE